MGQVQRRRLLIGIAASFAVPTARAQQGGRRFRVGALIPFSAKNGDLYLRALREGLAAHGFVDGKNLALELREVVNDRVLAKQASLEFVGSNVDAILSISTIATLGAQDATRTVPIVFSWVGDPVFSGIVKEFRRPGGNTTGVSNRFFELFAKRVELARELVPQAKQVVLIAGVFDATLDAAMTLAEPAAKQLGLTMVRKEAKSAGDWLWKEALAEAKASGAEAIIVATPFDQFGLATAAAQVVGEARRLRVPVVYSDLASVELGGLISYSYDAADEIRRGADHLARVLNGAVPSTLAVDQASRFKLAVNLRAAKDIGFNIPRALVVRADRVIE